MVGVAAKPWRTPIIAALDTYHTLARATMVWSGVR